MTETGVAEDGSAISENQVYANRIALRVGHSSAAGEAQELTSRCELWGTDVQTHILEVFAASGVHDLAARKQQVEAAAKRQQQLIAERKSRKKEKLRETARAAGGLASENKEATEKPNILDAAKKLVQANDGVESGAASGLTWTELEGFKTREEALQFIMECQPFDYMPENVVSRGDALPRFENCREAHAFVKGLLPPPSEFMSTTKDFKRRLRIRRVDPEQTAEDAEKRLVPTQRPAAGGAGLRGRRGSFLRSAATYQTAARPPPTARRKEHKEWRVEASGQLFERPTKLREDAVIAGARYYVAVASSVERRVLSEGFRVRRRTSIPCSATPQDAVRAFEGDDKPRASGLSLGRPSVSVLAVQVPAGVDVVPHRKGGFVIRVQELPASCFRRQRAAGAAP